MHYPYLGEEEESELDPTEPFHHHHQGYIAGLHGLSSAEEELDEPEEVCVRVCVCVYVRVCMSGCTGGKRMRKSSGRPWVVCVRSSVGARVVSEFKEMRAQVFGG